MLRLGHIELFVADPVGSMPFYRDALGFELVEVQGDKVVWLKSGDTELLLRPGANDTPAGNYQRAPIAMVLYTDDLTATTDRLAEHGIQIRGNDGPGCLTFTDPDGHWLQLVEFV
ncbi:MAG TPA: VOC family protein [Candidatus Kapabacteria bacterium]|nr:VOC family protein [Candidatus Kapabacteria bacterium]